MGVLAKLLASLFTPISTPPAVPHIRARPSPGRRCKRRGQGSSRHWHARRHYPRRRPSNQPSLVAYHGTTRAAATSILRDGWMVGPGQAYGQGIYFDVSKAGARAYGPILIKAKIKLVKSCHRTGNVIVVRKIRPQNPAAHKRRDWRIRVIAVLDGDTGKRIWV